jgi:penicillin-binding protein 1A
MQQYAEEAQREHLTEWQKIFFKFKEGSDPWKDYPKEWERTYTQNDRYRGYKAEGKSRAEIDKLMSTPIPMTIFTYEGEKDTVMSPKDSLNLLSFIFAKWILSCRSICWAYSCMGRWN